MGRAQTLRKALVLIGMGFASLADGYIFGHTSNMVAGLYAEKEQLHFTDDDISWIASMMFSTTVLGSVIATILTEKYGRRLTITLFHIPVVVHWIVLYYAKEKLTFLIIRATVGICFGGVLNIVFLSTAEYSSPSVRGINLILITAVFSSVGVAAGHILGIALNWRTAASIAILPSILATVIPIFMVESPQWLASKGRFVECEEAFIALHGCETSSKKELQLLLQVEKCKQKKKIDNEEQLVITLTKSLVVATKNKYFWDMIVLGTVLSIYKLICGRVLYTTLGTTILNNIVGHSNVLTFSFIIDLLFIIGSSFSALLLSKMGTRTLLFSGGFLNNLILIVLSIVLYTKPGENHILQWVNAFLYGLHLFVVNVALFPLLEMVPVELFPLEIKTTCILITSLICTIFMFFYIKLFPSMLALIDYYGLFTLNVLIMCCIILYVWIKMPETKNRTLQEIELYFKKNVFLNEDELYDETQIKELV